MQHSPEGKALPGDEQGVAAVRGAYVQRLESLRARREALQKRYIAIAWTRLLVFVVIIASIVSYAWGPGMRTALVSAFGWIAGAVFAALIVIHRKVAAERDRIGSLENINARGVARIDRNFKALEDVGLPELDAPIPAFEDLDLVGRASVFRLTGGCFTRGGKRRLASWLAGPSRPAEILERQRAVEELSRRWDLLERIELAGSDVSGKETDTRPFLTWAENPTFLTGKRWLLAVAWVLGPAPAVLGILDLVGVVEKPFWLPLLFVNTVLSGLLWKRIHAIFDAVSFHRRRVERYSDLLVLLSGTAFESQALLDLQKRVKRNGRRAEEQMRRLEKFSTLADLRFGMLHFPIQIFSLWDLHVSSALERWRGQVGNDVREWLDAVFEFEAHHALAVLRHDNPAWSFPRMLPDERGIFRAEALGHPLIPPERCVGNDVTLGPVGRVLLVTGSNMSGKSTLLRSIGVACALGQAGGPVAAGFVEMSPLELSTSFRVRDSIEEGVSFFMAELRRLKEIVDHAEEAQKRGTTLVFLLDEILQGTNIVERQIAVRSVLVHLLELGAIGAISSHDLTLATAPGVAERADRVYFTEKFEDKPEGPSMTFDYVLREGVAPTANALHLLRMVGLRTDGAETSDSG